MYYYLALWWYYRCESIKSTTWFGRQISRNRGERRSHYAERGVCAPRHPQPDPWRGSLGVARQCPAPAHGGSGRCQKKDWPWRRLRRCRLQAAVRGYCRRQRRWFLAQPQLPQLLPQKLGSRPPRPTPVPPPHALSSKEPHFCRQAHKRSLVPLAEPAWVGLPWVHCCRPRSACCGLTPDALRSPRW